MLIENKKALWNYEILQNLNAGIELFGFEVKALRSKQGSLLGAYVIVRGDEAFLVKATIPAYQPKNAPKSYDPERPRKLLLTKDEVRELAGLESKKGLTIVPLSVYNKGRKVKVEIGVARGKKQFDKRETLKRRDAEREMARTLKDA